ncbi:glycosyl transferase [Acidocella aquatica]|uniref:Glycosyl transferase n=1 Tax=Acidocella aquatica TaxID=1922313 RepID=A0ABQ6A6P1_9PROT|nr:glycosyltransferase [Acidocella aquatica]GLR67328.1 glycosyl transferase [Acidocella aquatica]
MRIAQIIAGSGAGGMYERMSLLLSHNGHQVFPVISPDPGLELRLRTGALAPMTLEFGGMLDFATLRDIREVLQARKAQIALAWTGRAATFLPRGPWVNVGRLDGYYGRNEFGLCAYLAGSTRGIASHIAQSGFSPAKVLYLPDFVEDYTREDPVGRAALGVPEAAPLLLGLGPLERSRGFDTLIRAAALLPDMYCVIAGEGPERVALSRLIAQLRLEKRVRLLGARRDTGALLKAADVFVCPARQRPLGPEVLEAFSAQTPVLATDVEGEHAVVRDGEDGLLVPVDDPGALAAAAGQIFNDTRLRVKLALAARQRFVGEFSPKAVLGIWLENLQKLLP